MVGGSVAEVVITGGGGFLGVRLAEELLARGHRVRILSRKRPESKYFVALGVEHVAADILEPASLARAFAGIDVVFHCAGLVSYDPKKAELMYQTNVVGTRNVGEAALAAGVKRLVQTSSIAAIGVNYDPRATMNEAMAFNAEPLGMAYFTTKYAAEQELHKLRARGLDYVIVNPGSILGPRDTRKKGQVYAGIIQKLNPPLALPGGNNFVDIEDVVRGHILAWEKGRVGERYILGGENLTFAELIARVNRLLGRPAPRFTLPAAAMSFVAGLLSIARALGLKANITPALVRRIGRWYLFVDSSKARRELGYEPHAVDGALARTLAWLKAEGYSK